jgi:protein-tyrosine phosphatase
MFGPGFYLNHEFVRKNNITHIVNCAFEDAIPSQIQSQFGDNYVCLNAVDSFEANITEWYPEFEHSINTFLRDPDVGIVYINCQMGVNRSGFLTTLYACLKLGYPYESVTKAILLQRPCALMNPTYHTQVQDYIKKHR